MESEKKASLLRIVKITAILMLITTLTALLLAVINMLTEPVIAANDEKTKQNAILELFPEADATTLLNDELSSYYPDDISEVYAVYEGKNLLGYCADVSSKGFSDDIGMMVGVNSDSTVRGIKILSISDTPGLGMKVNNAEYLSQYNGLSAPISFDGVENQVDAISGASYSSRGVLNGVNTVLDFCSRIQVVPAQSGEAEPQEADTTSGDAEREGETTTNE